MGKQGFGKELGREIIIWEGFRLGKQGFGKDSVGKIRFGKDLGWDNKDLTRI